MLDSPYTDAELLALLIEQNDLNAFDILFNRYWKLVYKTVFIHLRDADASADVVNDLFMAIWIKRKSLKINSVKSYLTAAARYRVYNYIRDHKNTKLNYVDSYEQLDQAYSDSNQGETNFKLTDLHHALSIALAKLPQRCREIFILSKMEDLSNAEIASKFYISKRTVENQLSIAIKYLRACFKSYLIVLIIIRFLFNH
ncbi:MAG: sigma-70 family RNA polymerase sigma factor [Mucilaginibacter sp.]|uniref:sigma-70 family RNA polymerase sigma factor n=1 Tax=Mucilaginibacter sp. TaxID=1882438 RepID=UPI00319FF7C4